LTTEREAPVEFTVGLKTEREAPSPVGKPCQEEER
jgi:hypothetical protein